MDNNNKPWEQGPLKITDNGRYFANGEQPFFWLADTAWLLFHELTMEETREYLEDRKAKGFNIILADLMHAFPQMNRAGDTALIDEDFTKPDLSGTYWSHIDEVVSLCEEMGLYIGLFPVWGSKIVKGEYLKIDAVDAYSDFLAKRYGQYPHVIWIIGGDVKPEGDDVMAVFDRMGEYFRKANPDKLITYHPFGRNSSSQWFHNREWLDFNLFQSGHRRYDQARLRAWDDNPAANDYFGPDNWKYVDIDLAHEPKKPTLDGEPSYEHVLQGLHVEGEPYWQAEDARRYAYWPVFAGAAGHTYGDNSIMQFYKDKSKKGAFGVKDTWREALHHPGGGQMQYLKELMESVDYVSGTPNCNELLIGGQREQYHRIALWRNRDVILAYDYLGEAFSLDLSEFAGREAKLSYMNPEDGKWSEIQTFKAEAVLHVALPNRGDVNDWVVKIEFN